MDPLPQLVITIGTLIAAVIVAAFVGGRKGLADVEARSDAEMARLVTALEGRIKVLTAELAEAQAQIQTMRAEIETLRKQTADLKADLAAEQRITARFMGGK